MTILDSWRRKSRGKVRCSLCGTTISKGVEYLVQKTVDAGTLWEDFYDALQYPSPDLTVRDARIMCAYLARIGTEEYR